VAPASLTKELPAHGFAIARVEGDKGILFHHRREVADGEWLFLVNTSIEAPSGGILESDLAGVERWDLYTGETGPYPFEKSGSGIRSSFNLPPSGSLLLYLSRKPLSAVAPKPEIVHVIKAEGTPEIQRQGPNVLTLDYVDITAGGEGRTKIYVYQANQFAWKRNGMERNPWDSAVQFKDELITKKFAADSGFTASYRFNLEGAVPRNLAIVIERPDLYTITCNGKALKAKPGDWWLDRAFGRISLASVACVGENVVTLKAAPFTMFHELESAYVLGDFRLKPVESGFVITADRSLSLGSCKTQTAEPGRTGEGRGASAIREGWNSQGHPFYSAGVTYREQFEVKNRAGRFVVSLPNWYGSVAKVAINGKLAGMIDAPPFECDVTNWIKRGRNEVEVTVIGTLKNTLGPHHGNPALGAAWPSAFHKAPASGPPPGTEYSTVAYGLFAPFVLKQIQL
jgi:hypothetical protein